MPFSSYLFNSLSSHQPKTFPPPSMISHHSKSSTTTTTTTNFFERIEEQKHRPDFMTKSFPRCFTLKLPSMLPVDQEEVKVSKTSSTVVAVEARANLQVEFFPCNFTRPQKCQCESKSSQTPFWALFMGFQITGRAGRAVLWGVGQRIFILTVSPNALALWWVGHQISLLYDSTHNHPSGTCERAPRSATS